MRDAKELVTRDDKIGERQKGIPAEAGRPGTASTILAVARKARARHKYLRSVGRCRRVLGECRAEASTGARDRRAFRSSAQRRCSRNIDQAEKAVSAFFSASRRVRTVVPLVEG